MSFLIFVIVAKSLKTPFFWISQCRKSSSIKTTDSSFFLPKTTGHFIMSYFCWQKNSLWLLMKTLLLLLTKSPNARKFCFSDCSLSSFRFFSFSFFRLLRPLLQIFKFWIIQTPAKCTNQITLSKKHMNYLFRMQGNLVQYSINP